METPTSAGAEAAEQKARSLAGEPWTPVAPAGRTFRRRLALGDPQAPLRKVLAILGRHQLLAADGWLRPDVSLLSIGDHFDFGSDPAAASGDGLALLRWLAAHPPDQVVLIAGNHDLGRVMELAFETDASFAAARALAATVRRAAHEGRAEEAARLRGDFAAAHPHIPTPEVATRDLSSFTVAQRRLVQDLLLGGRFRLAQAARGLRLDGGLATGPLLFVHAGLTTRELDVLGVPAERDPGALARRLDTALRDAVDRVRGAWERGLDAALDLGPLSPMGTTGREGGGFLYHRPGDRTDPTEASERWDRERPRRFSPEALPRGLRQAVGHAGHHKTCEELRAWATGEAKAVDRGGVRTLRLSDAGPAYDLGLLEGSPGDAVLHMFDGEMNAVPVDSYRLPEVDEWR